MTKSELKQKLKLRIDDIDDLKLLTMIERLLPEALSEITEEELQKITETQDRFIEKYFYTQEQVDEILKDGLPPNLKQNC